MRVTAVSRRPGQQQNKLIIGQPSKNDLKQLINRCKPCQRLRPSLPKEPIITTTAEFPMQKTSADLFQVGTTHYLIMVDRYSRYPFVTKLNNIANSAITTHLTAWFRWAGYPASIRTDGRAQFRGQFKAYCGQNGINHELSSPYHPESNGHSEAAVKNIKYLLLKVSPEGLPISFQ